MQRKTALITGASGGIGLELARFFAKDGYDLVLIARNQQKLDEVAAKLAAENGIEVMTLACDLAAREAPRSIFSFTEKHQIEVDALANNAGFGYDAAFVESDLQRQRDLLQVNNTAVMELCRLFGEQMAKRGSGEILNIASMAGFMPGAYMATYYASKAFVQSFSQALHAELAPFGVKVTALCPGPLRTNFWRAADADKTILGNMLANPTRVAHAGYRALKRNKPLCIPWVFPRIVVFLVRFLPYRFTVWCTKLIQNPKQQKRRS